jgi:hypothetical protein
VVAKPIVVVTSWGPGGWDLYARRFVSSFLANFPANVVLHAYYHDHTLPADAPHDPRIEYISLNDDPSHEEAQKHCAKHDGKMVGGYDFRFDAAKFNHKAFAIASSYAVLSQDTGHDGDYLVWMDADTYATGPVPDGFFEKLFVKPIGALMRKDCRYAETSFMWFHLANPVANVIVAGVAWQYASGGFTKAEEWHDGWLYSQELKRHPDLVTDIAPDSQGLDAFHQSPLAACFTHLKGNKKNMAQPFRVKPVDVLPKPEILENIRRNIELVPNRLQEYLPHQRRAYIVGSGPSVHAEKLWLQHAYASGYTIVAVKHSMPILRELGIEPHYCVVLDPRTVEGDSTHGAKRKDLYGGYAGRTEFLVASMTAVDTVQHLMNLKAKITLWHAFTQSAADAGVIPPDEALIVGGTCAAMRAVGIMYTMGFRRLNIVGVDASQAEPPPESERSIVGVNGPKWFQVGTDPDPKVGIKWWTTGELVALAQDVDELARKTVQDASITWHGASLAREMWDAVGRKELPEYGS